MATTNKHWFPELLKDKYVKLVFKILLTAIAIFILFFIGRSMLGYNVKFFGIDTNPEKPKNDTIREVRYVEVPKIKDSPIVLQPTKKLAASYPVVIKTVSKDSMPKVQSTVTGDNNKTVVGNNSGIVGDVTINNGSPQRHLTEGYAKMIIKRLEDTLKANNLGKNVLIRFGSTMGSDESLVFTNEVANFLYDKGYTNISNNVGPTMGNNTLRILYLNNEIFIDVGRKPLK